LLFRPCLLPRTPMVPSDDGDCNTVNEEDPVRDRATPAVVVP